jgi:hypothetical protein
MTNHNHNWRGAGFATRFDNPAHHRLASDFMGDLGEIAFHARAFSCCEDDRCEVAVVRR